MYNTKYIIRYQRLIYHLKSIGKLAFVPIIVVDIIIPIVNFYTYMQGGIQELRFNIILLAQNFIPFFSVWWIIFVLREYVESDGKELLYVNKSRSKFTDILYLYILYCINMFFIFIIYNLIIPKMIYECIRIFSISMFYFGITYSFIYLTNSTTLSLMLNLIYTIQNIVNIKTPKYPFYYDVNCNNLELDMYFKHYFPLLITGVVFLIIGFKLNKKLLRV